MTSSHTLTLMREDNRNSSHFGQFFMTERMGQTVIKFEYIETYNRDHAYDVAKDAARLYGAEFIDRLPNKALTGFSAD